MYFKNVTNFEELRKEYKKLAFAHHPDRGGKVEIMQAINAEYDILFKKFKDVHNTQAETDSTGKKKHIHETPEAFREAISKIIHLDGVVIELCGSWLWLSGKTYEHREEIKKAGFEWSKTKKEWYWHAEQETTYIYRGKTTKAEIRKKYGSETISTEKPNYIKEPKKEKEKA